MEKLLVPALHLIILLGFVVYKAKTPFMNFIKTRHQSVVEGLNRSKNQAAEAAMKKKEIDVKLASLDLEKQKILAEWKEREHQQLIAIQDGSKRLVQQMKAEAERNLKALEESFHSETIRSIGRSVLKQAQEKIMKSLTPEAHQRINAEFANELLSSKEAVS